MAFLGMIDAHELEPDHTGESASRPVDLVHLARHTLGNHDLEREVLELFVRQSAHYLTRIRSAETVTERRAAAHTIKGSARGIGAWHVADAAEAAETVNGDDYAALDDALVSLHEAVATANAFIETFLRDFR